MKGTLNAVFDRSNGVLVSEEYRAGASSVSFSTTNHANSSAGTNLFLGDLYDKAKTRSSSAFQLNAGMMLSVNKAAHHVQRLPRDYGNMRPGDQTARAHSFGVKPNLSIPRTRTL